MLIETMPEVLSWSAGKQILLRVHDAYLTLLSKSLGEVLGQICKEDPAMGSRLVTGMRAISDEALLRILAAPETSARLLWRRTEHLCETGNFIERSIQAEAARASQPQSFTKQTWTALGDMGFFPDGDIYRMPSIEGMMPLDFGSPHAARIDLSGAERIDVEPRPGFNDQEKCLVLERLKEAQNGIRVTSKTVADFVLLFNKVLVLQKDPDTPQQFSSGSFGRYIGLSYMANPHETFVDHVDLADAAVHEGIHSLLYMQERKKRWFLDLSLFESVAQVTSPWTGNSLSLASFLQACFVWYGLLHFWRLALSARAFDRQRICDCVSRSLRGFQGEPLLARLSYYASGISPDLLETIDEVQTAAIKAV
jgi:hypothetical protein